MCGGGNTSTPPSANEHACSFCGKAQKQVKRLIAGPGNVFICDECVRLCQQIVTDEHPSAAPQAASPPFTADEIEKLASLKDRGVLTQEEFDAKKRQLLGL